MPSVKLVVVNGFKLTESVNELPSAVVIVSNPLEESYVKPVTPATATDPAESIWPCALILSTGI